MKTQRVERFDAIGRLFRYPGDDYADDVQALAKRLALEESAAATVMEEFAAYTAGASLYELEETFTRTFDLNPSCSPEIGWHLFGEEYVRGLFMVHMRNQMRERGLEESGELPDHLVHVLAVIAEMDEEPAREMARACLCPAIGKMLASIDKEQTKKNAAPQPFRPLVAAVAELALAEFELPPTALEAIEEEQNAFSDGTDPLHSSPCGGCGSGDVVTLDELVSQERGEVASTHGEENHR